MIGQPELTRKLNNISFDNLPSSIILVGEEGCGKHLFCKELSTKLQIIDFIYVNDKVNYDFVESCYLNANPTIYIIDSDKLSVREQNVILKLFEEPPQLIKIILLSTNINNIIPTILNRAMLWEFEHYSTDVLKQFVTNQELDVLKFAYTPGQIKNANSNSLKDMIDLSDLMLDKISNASVSNVLSLSSKFNFKEDDDKFNLKVFLRIFKCELINKMHIDKDKKYFNAYKLVLKLEDKLNIPRINKKNAFEKFILELKYTLQ